MAEELNKTTPATTEEVFAHLAKLAAENGDDFRIKVLRKESEASPPDTVAVFDGALLEHITVPEAWLVPFAGGGPYFVLFIYHAKEPQRIAAILKLPRIVQPKIDPPNLRLVGSREWRGPHSLIYPRLGEGAPANGAASPREPTSGAPSPAAPEKPGSMEHLLRQLQDERRQIAEERRQVEERRHQAEIEAVRRENQAAQKASEDRLRTLEDLIRAQATQKPAGPSIVEILTAVTPILAPIATALITSGQETRKAMLSAEERRLALEAQRHAEEKGRPLIPPEVVTLLKEQHSGAAEQAKVFASMAEAQNIQNRASQEAQATLTRTTLQTVTMLLEAARGGGEAQEDPWVKVLTEGMRSLQALAEANKVRNAVPRLPPKPPPAARPPPPRQAAQPAKPNGATQSPLLEKPNPEPVPAEQGPPNLAAYSRDLDTVERLIRAEASPKIVIDLFFETVEVNPQAKAELAAVKGDIAELFTERLGEAWLNANLEYVQKLADEIGRQAEERGIDVDEGEEQEQEESHG